MGDPLSSSSFLRRTLPPYYKYAVFLLCGFDLVFSCFVLAISEAYYKVRIRKGRGKEDEYEIIQSAKTVLPIAYGMFNDTITKGKDNFTWDQSMQDSLELVSTHLSIL